MKVDGIYIPLTQGQFAVVDHIDADLAARNWSAVKAKHVWYAFRGAAGSHQFLHRIVATRMGLDITGREVYHKDRDRLNNRRTNLAPGRRR